MGPRDKNCIYLNELAGWGNTGTSRAMCKEIGAFMLIEGGHRRLGEGAGGMASARRSALQ